MNGAAMTCPLGDWQIALADFVVANGVPSLNQPAKLQPRSGRIVV